MEGRVFRNIFLATLSQGGSMRSSVQNDSHAGGCAKMAVGEDFCARGAFQLVMADNKKRFVPFFIHTEN